MFNGVFILVLLLSAVTVATGVEVYRKFKDFDNLDFFVKSLPSSPLTTVSFIDPAVTTVTHDKVLVTGPACVYFLDVDGFLSKTISLKTLTLECLAPASVTKEPFSIGSITITSSFGEFSGFSATFDNGCVVSLDLV